MIMAAAAATSINKNFEDDVDDDLSLTHHHNHQQLNSIPWDQPSDPSAAAMDFELEQELNTHLMQEEVLHDPNTASQPTPFEQQNWDFAGVVVNEMQDMGTCHEQEAQLYQQQVQQDLELHQHNLMHCYNNSTTFTNPLYTETSTPDLLNLLHLPGCSTMLPNSSISFTNPNRKQGSFNTPLDIFGELSTEMGENGSGSSILYDPSLHLNLPPQPPIFRELLHSLPHGYNFTAGGSSTFFGGGMDEDQEGVHGQVDGESGRMQYENSILDFSREMNTSLRNRGGGHEIRGRTIHFTTEKHRRQQFNQKFDALRLLVPNPSKPDRASVVGDAIDYIKELRRTVDELKLLVEQKRCRRERNKKLKTDEAGGAGEVLETSSMKPPATDREQSYDNGALRSSWLQRKSKETEVDVRIIDDEVTIKLIQRKKMNCLLSVSKILEELQLDLLHVSGGNIGDYYSFLFNTKIYEGSSVYANAIARKLIEGVDKPFAPFTSY